MRPIQKFLTLIRKEPNSQNSAFSRKDYRIYLYYKFDLIFQPITPFVGLSSQCRQPLLPVKWRSSRSNNSATRAKIYKRIGVCESPRDKLCHKQNFMSKFEVSEFCRAFEFLDWGGGSHSAIVILPYLKEYLEY